MLEYNLDIEKSTSLTLTPNSKLFSERDGEYK